METQEKVIFTSIVMFIIVFVGYVAFEWSKLECVKYREEQYMVAPMTMQVGSGIGMPLGNIETRTRTVCDEYKLKSV